ncbi:hypothetical protein [Nonomuraea turcica]|uniref:hypothetical protein n=1 Tax=Nonomuraea sp. G32 TaxID=3067274 RepID=UPI00273ADE81|nr:hypothetical protein [Nonomuraea sp. G32]MDP4504935.1 hypothetical protein [Nonomuraea sp. G32]
MLETRPATAPVDRDARLSLIGAGRHVLHGRQDHVTLNGVDRWIGGVHLAGRAVPWRWNEGAESTKPV